MTMHRAIHSGRVLWDLANLVFSLPILALHELAHYVACVPLGGPAGVYYIRDTARPGIRSKIPVGAAVCHEIDADHPLRPFVSLAPLAYLLALYPVGGLVTSPAAATATLVVFLAGVLGFADALNYFAPDRYRELFDPDGAHEFVRLIDLTPWTGGEAPKREFMREEVAD